jgi:hypothetical protein
MNRYGVHDLALSMCLYRLEVEDPGPRHTCQKCLRENLFEQQVWFPTAGLILASYYLLFWQLEGGSITYVQ